MIPSYHDPSKHMKLIFSDEFETDRWSFYPGDDLYWEAANLHYWQTGDLEWYNSLTITTKNGVLEIMLTKCVFPALSLPPFLFLCPSLLLSPSHPCRPERELPRQRLAQQQEEAMLSPLPTLSQEEHDEALTICLTLPSIMTPHTC
ncbi:beta-glucan synthesis-associated protein-domain-containing protein [Mycena albidolilacea]|uniref:Beta-glucan synthesis-associated protein-domain-containing protein n=1 Tax=Mycena albidolilacea TaxID=1033008 RepID=A0AAD6Z7J2_9AGAR|nr:beta-glucan synthesis-associated protein-domain-containing protein [Mycena albidolilacea]